MSNDDVAVNDPAYTVATDAVLQSIFDFLSDADPEARKKVGEHAKRRLDAIDPDNKTQEEFMRKVRKAVEQIVRAPTA